DAQTWKDLGWHLLLLPIGIVGFTVAVVCWAWTLGLITMPLWYSLTTDPAQVGGVTVDAWYWALLAFAVGILTLPISVALLRATAAGTGALSRLLLRADAERRSARVEAVPETRAGAVDAAAAELERIERDLHDGAQARLVARAMDLGLAQERFARDPGGA